MKDRLTPKQELFIEFYTGECMFNGTRSAERAGYSGSLATMAQVGKGNIRKPHIKLEIDKRIKERFGAANVTVDGVLQDINVMYYMALQDRNYSGMGKAVELKGKYLKMYTERIEHVRTFDDMSDEELETLAKHALEQLGIKPDESNIQRILSSNAAPVETEGDPAGIQTTH